MSFEDEHEKWLSRHRVKRSGDRLDALKRGHGYGNRLFIEKIWWPLMGHFEGLHPEHEVRDWRGRSYFTDFMLQVGSIRIVFEIMDYGSHGKERAKFRQDLNRGLFLQSQDCLVYYISLDELIDNPTFILSVVRSILNPFAAVISLSMNEFERKFSKAERDLMRIAIRDNRLIRPYKAAIELDLCRQTITKYCHNLVDKGKLRAIKRGESNRIHYYEYIGTLQSPDLV